MYCHDRIPEEGKSKEGELFWIMILGNIVHHVVREPVPGVLCYLTLIEQEAEKILGRKRTEVIPLGLSLLCLASSS